MTGAGWRPSARTSRRKSRCGTGTRTIPASCRICCRPAAARRPASRSTKAPRSARSSQTRSSTATPVRARRAPIPVKTDGAGYKAEMVDILTSSDSWYRASDCAIAPDGSLVIADWYDPGVGGHAMGDHEPGKIMGRIYRVSATGGAKARRGHRSMSPPRPAQSARCSRRIAPRNTWRGPRCTRWARRRCRRSRSSRRMRTRASAPARLAFFRRSRAMR